MRLAAPLISWRCGRAQDPAGETSEKTVSSTRAPSDRSQNAGVHGVTLDRFGATTLYALALAGAAALVIVPIVVLPSALVAYGATRAGLYFGVRRAEPNL